MMSLAAVPNDHLHHQPNRPRLRLVPRPPRMTQREMVILSLIRCPDAVARPDRS
jgi:hypothetical protein